MFAHDIVSSHLHRGMTPVLLRSEATSCFTIHGKLHFPVPITKGGSAAAGPRGCHSRPRPGRAGIAAGRPTRQRSPSAGPAPSAPPSPRRPPRVPVPGPRTPNPEPRPRRALTLRLARHRRPSLALGVGRPGQTLRRLFPPPPPNLKSHRCSPIALLTSQRHPGRLCSASLEAAGPRDLRHQAPERRAGAGAGRREVGPRVAMATPGAPEPRDAPAHPRFRPASRLGGLSARLARLWGLRRRPFPLPMAAAAARCRMGVAGPAHKQESLQARGGRHRLCTRHAAAHSGPRRREDARAARRGPAEPRARRGGRPSPPPPRTRGTRKRRRSATATSAWGAPGLGCAPAPQVRGIPRLRFRPRITTSDQQTPVYKEPRATVSLLERKRCGGNASVFHPGSDDTRLRFYQRVERRKVTSFVVTPAGVDTSTELEQAGLRGPGQCFPVNLLVSSSVIRLLLMLNFPYREIIIRG
jgi:hypothetical protein